MSNYKYPYIPKEYYAAVMFACKMVRENGFKNKAIKTAANYYDVDEEELKKHFEARSVAGHKNSHKKQRKYKYFVVGVFYGCDANGIDEMPDELEVCKGLSKQTVESRFIDADMRFDMHNDTGSAFSPYRYHTVLSEHSDKADADKMCVKLSKTIRAGDVKKYRALTGGER